MVIAGHSRGNTVMACVPPIFSYISISYKYIIDIVWPVLLFEWLVLNF